MKIRATFDDDGRPIGFYPEDVWPKNYPEDAVEITPEQYHEFLNNQGHRAYVNGEVVECEPPNLNSEAFYEGLDKYHLALGRFVSKFAEIEGQLFGLLMLRSGVPLDTLNVLTPAMVGMKGILQRLEALLVGPNNVPDPRFVRVKAHLGTIMKRRNDLMHISPRYNAEGHSIVDNLRKTKFRPWNATPEILNQMTHDLDVIAAGIAVQMLAGIAPEAFVDEGFGPASETEWQYKEHQL